MNKQISVKTKQEGAVLSIRLSNSKTRNSLTTNLREQLGEAVKFAEIDASIRSVYLTGDGESFCSGGDFQMLKTHSDPWSVHYRFKNLQHWLSPLITLSKPVVIGVRGHAVGGGMGLALSGDMIIAGESARFISGFFRIGAIPDIGMMYHLPRMIGMARAKDFLFNNKSFSALDARELGLVSEVVPDHQVDDRGIELATKLAEGPIEVMSLAKSIMARSFETSLHDMFALEGFAQALAMSSSEFREGLDAVINKRPANFARAGKK